jgi:hypothetical protein
MPYVLRKAPNRNLYWVVTKETGKKHSRLPISLDKAKAQQRILEQALHGGATIEERGMAALIREKYTIPDQGLRAELNGIVHSNNEESSITTANARVLDPSVYKAFSKRPSWKGVPPAFVTPTPTEYSEGDFPKGKGIHGGSFPQSLNAQDIENVRKFLQGDAMFSLLPQRLTSYLGRISLDTLPMPLTKIYVTLKRQGRREEDIDDEFAQLIQSNHPMFANFIKAIKEDLAEYDLVNTTVSTARSVLDGQGKKRSKRVPFQGPPAEVIMPIGQGKCRCKC